MKPKPALADLAKLAKSFHGYLIEISGYASNRLGSKTDQKLSEERAAAVLVQFTNDRNVMIEADKFTFPDSRMEFWQDAQLVAIVPLPNVLYVLDQDRAKAEAAACRPGPRELDSCAAVYGSALVDNNNRERTFLQWPGYNDCDGILHNSIVVNRDSTPGRCRQRCRANALSYRESALRELRGERMSVFESEAKFGYRDYFATIGSRL